MIIHPRPSTRMNDLQIRQRRKIRKLFEDEVLDVDDINEACSEMGMEPLLDEVPVMVELERPPRPVIRLPRETRNDGHGAVYVVRSANGLYKIGSARNAERRLRTLQTGSADRLEIVHIIHTKQSMHTTVERTLHHRLADKRVAGEWFRLTPEDLAAIVQLKP